MKLTRLGGHLPNNGSCDRRTPWRSAISASLMMRSRLEQVGLVMEEGKTRAQVALDLDIGPPVLGNWVKARGGGGWPCRGWRAEGGRAGGAGHAADRVGQAEETG